MSWHVYDISKRRVGVFATYAIACQWVDARPRRFFRLWDDRTGEEWERKGGEWRGTAAPDSNAKSPA